VRDLTDPFRARDSAAGLADGGTLYLDGVDALPLELQGSLLRALDGVGRAGTALVPARARLVASTRRDLGVDVLSGTFRQDLHNRLAGKVVRIPPLRQRRADIPRLAAHFLAERDPTRAWEWSAGFVETLALYDWPINVRELQSVLARLGPIAQGAHALQAAHLPEPVRSRQHLDVPAGNGPAERSDAPARQELETALARFRGNVAQLSAHYGKDRKQLYRWLRRHQLRPEDFRAAR
jgi:DNA-binding NtrC family response regulator